MAYKLYYFFGAFQLFSRGKNIACAVVNLSHVCRVVWAGRGFARRE